MYKKSILLDFDGTLVYKEFPNIGEPIPMAIETIKELQKKYNIVLYTMRNHDNPIKYRGKLYYRDLLQEAIDYCKSVGIELSEINEIKSQSNWTSTKHKLYSPLRIDDDNAGIPLGYKKNSRNKNVKYVDWTKLRLWLKEEGWIE